MTKFQNPDGVARPSKQPKTLSQLKTTDEFLVVLRGVAEFVRDWNAGGRLYGPIHAAQIVYTQSAGTWSLLPPPLVVDLTQISAEASWYELLANSRVEELPARISDAQMLADSLGFSGSIEIVDCFSLGELACRLLADCSVADYLRSPKALSRIPVNVRPFIDSALGFDASRRAERVDQLLPLLESCKQSPKPPGSPIPGKTRHKASAATKKVPQSGSDVPFAALGHFRLVRLVGHGGMGDVYEGYDDSLQRKVAIKVLPTALGSQASFVQRFYSEAASVAKIVHPNIVQIFFIGEDRGHHFFAMEFVDGDSLADRLSVRSKLPVAEAISVTEQILRGLSAAHAKGLVHRDVKPGNILVEGSTGRCLLVDFGLVKSLQEENGPTHSGMVLGTMDYISPEQGRGKSVDGRSDLYALGVVLYEMISGRLPFAADSPTGMIFQHVYDRPEPLHSVDPQTPVGVSAIVARLMAKDPSQRYANADAVLADLNAYSRGMPLPSRAVQMLVEDPSLFSRPAPASRADTARSVIIRAPEFDEVNSDFDVLNRAQTSLLRQWISKWHDWLEAKSPVVAQRFQSTQLQIDRAILKLERHRDHLASLDRNARLILKELKQQIVGYQEATDSKVDAVDSLHVELQRAVTEQQQQSDEIHSQLNRVNVQLAQIRTERDVLVARLQSAQARSRMHSETRRPFSYVAWILLGVAALVLILPTWKYLRNPAVATTNAPPLAVVPFDASQHPGATKTATDEVSGILGSVANAEMEFDRSIETAKKTLCSAYLREIVQQTNDGKLENVTRLTTGLQFFESVGYLMEPELEQDYMRFGQASQTARESLLKGYQDASAKLETARLLGEVQEIQQKIRDRGLISTLVSIQLTENPGLYVMHRNYKIYVEEIPQHLRLNATFDMVAGLLTDGTDSKARAETGIQGQPSEIVSFRSVSAPGHYLAHGNHDLILQRYLEALAFRQNSSFRIHKGLWQSSGVSFEAVNIADQFLTRKPDGTVRLERRQPTERFSRSATFNIVAPKFPLWSSVKP